jgi:hypothetical protein
MGLRVLGPRALTNFAELERVAGSLSFDFGRSFHAVSPDFCWIFAAKKVNAERKTAVYCR